MPKTPSPLAGPMPASGRQPSRRAGTRGKVEGRLTLGLYNSYAKDRFAEAHRRALARAGAVAAAFDCNLVTFGFPFDLIKPTDDTETTPPKGPKEVAERVAASTTIGDDGRYFIELAQSGRFHIEDLPGKGFPPQYGRPVLTTRQVPAEENADALGLANELARGSSLLLIIGLGPHGLPRALHKTIKDRWDLTGRGTSLETCTALSAAPAILHTHLQHARTAHKPATQDPSRRDKP